MGILTDGPERYLNFFFFITNFIRKAM